MPDPSPQQNVADPSSQDRVSAVSCHLSVVFNQMPGGRRGEEGCSPYCGQYMGWVDFSPKGCLVMLAVRSSSAVYQRAAGPEERACSSVWVFIAQLVD